MNQEEKYIAIARNLINDDKDSEYNKTWNKIEEMKEIEEFDTDNAWGKMMNRFEEQELLPPSGAKAVKSHKFRWTTIAASIILGIISGTLWNTFVDTEIYMANNSQEVVVHVMADGSEIYLKPGAEISYEKDFNEAHRNLTLKGEAFFDVERNENIPFQVFVEDALVTVLGTSFNVRVVENTKLVEVLVKTGKVTLSANNQSNHSIALVPDEMGVFNQGQLEIIKPESANYLSWMNKKLVFKDVSLSQVIDDLSRSYGVEILLLNANMDTLSITSTYQNLEADELIRSICLTLNLNYEKQEKKYILVSQ